MVQRVEALHGSQASAAASAAPAASWNSPSRNQPVTQDGTSCRAPSNDLGGGVQLAGSKEHLGKIGPAVGNKIAGGGHEGRHSEDVGNTGEKSWDALIGATPASVQELFRRK